MRKNIAVFMIFLIVTLPISSMGVFAGGHFKSITVTGENENYEQFLKSYDRISIDAEVYIDKGALNPDQVMYGLIPFDQCSAGTDVNTHTCSYTASSLVSYVSNAYVVPLTLEDENGTHLASSSTPIYIDSLPPSISEFSVSPNPAGDENVTITYTVREHSYSNSRYDKCVGLDTITIFDSQGTIEEIDGEDECSIRSSVKKYAPDLAASEQTVEICINAIDNFEHLSDDKCFNLDVDTSGPSSTNLVFKDTDGDIINYIAVETTVLDMFVNVSVSGQDLVQSTVKADLFNLNDKYTYMRTADSCKFAKEESGRKVYECKWRISVFLESTTTASITINATDVVGNEVSNTMSKTINVDNTQPIINNIVTNFYHDGTYYLRPHKNTIVAQISDTGSGISNETVEIDFRKYGGVIKKANKCTSNLCYWYNMSISGQNGDTVSLYIWDESTDLVGNRFANGFLQNFTLDNVAPRVEYINLNSTGILSQFNISMAMKGDTLYIEANITDTVTPVLEAYANLSEIAGVDNMSGTCTELDDNVWNCQWAHEISGEGFKQYPIELFFRDFVGNNITTTEYFVVYGVGNATDDYWRHTVGKPSPSKIDKQVMTLYNTFTFYPIELKPKKSKTDIRPLYMSIGNCSKNETYLRQNVPILYNFMTPNSAKFEFYLKYLFDLAVPPTDKLGISCDLEVISLLNNKTISKSEIESVNVTIDFYNLPYGELSDNVDDEIERVKDGWLVSQEWLDSIEKLLNIAKLICGLINTANSVLQIWSTITGLFGTCCASMIVSASCCTQQQQSATKSEGLAGSLKSMMKKGQKYCAMLNCRYSTEEDDNWKNEQGFSKWWNWAKQTTGSNKGWMGNVEPKNSLILSVVFLCLPGIVYNLQKARVIECQYIECLEESANGMPLSMCVEQRGFLFCKYVWGELFNLIPFAAAFSNIATNVKNALQNAPTLLLTGVQALCTVQCKTPGLAGGCSICYWLSFLDELVGTFCSLGIEITGKECEAVWEDLEVDDSVCAEVLDD